MGACMLAFASRELWQTVRYRIANGYSRRVSIDPYTGFFIGFWATALAIGITLASWA
jgi:hypothetical protein